MSSRNYPAYDWNRLRYPADSLWQQGIRSCDRTVIMLMYGYSGYDADILCEILAERERVADYYLNYYNPDLGF